MKFTKHSIGYNLVLAEIGTMGGMGGRAGQTEIFIYAST